MSENYNEMYWRYIEMYWNARILARIFLFPLHFIKVSDILRIIKI